MGFWDTARICLPVVEYLRKANSAMATTIKIRKLTRRGSAMVTGPSGM